MEIQSSSAAISFKEITKDICRVCLLTSRNNKCIFSITNVDKTDDSRLEFKRKLEMHGGIELAEDDGLPSTICVECIIKVNAAYELWEQCQKADQKLREFYKKPQQKRSSTSIVLKDELCQTEDAVQSLVEEEDAKSNVGQGILASEPNEEALLTIKTEKVSMETDKIEWRRTRRLSMFKRVTSMENLKSHKERQRQHMKKNKNPRLDSVDADSSEANVNIDNSLARVCDTETSRLHQCLQCNRAYSNKKSLDRHSLSHSDDKTRELLTSVGCNICGKNFKKTDTMVRHLNIHKKANVMEVYEILRDIRARKKPGNQSDVTKSLLKDHVNENVEGNIMSTDTKSLDSTEYKPLDSKSTIKLINTWIREQLDSDNEGKGFSCSFCRKSYVTKKSLLKHQQSQHHNEEECSKKTDEAKKRIVQESTSHKCEKCNKTFEKNSQLQKHMRVHDQDSNFKRFLCHICSKTFRQNTGLMFHMRTHTGYKPHVCKYCGRGFTSNSNCINHERTHTGDRPFVCHFCSAAFAKSCTLKSHITTHTGEANYHCKTCGKSFRRLKYLKEHKFTHTGEKPYACKICGTAYSHSGSLFVHEKKCKAQLSNYQSSTASASQIYCTSQATVHTTSMISAFNSPPPVSSNKNYVESLQKINALCGAHQHSVNDPLNVSAAVRSLSITGQMFNT